MSITTFLNNKGFNHFEGYSQQCKKQVIDLIELTKESKLIMEIGFNAGHSAEVFLENNKNLKMVSFDIGSHDYVVSAKEYIDQKYPDRHTLILGDSAQTVAEYALNNPTIFDFIFIDGGHEYNIAKADITNCSKLANPYTVVAVDDTIFTKDLEASWNIGPTRVWNEYLDNSLVMELNRKEYGHGRGMVWGKYTL